MGWTFLWAFLDKTFALGFATGRDPQTGIIDFFGPKAWIHEGSPTAGLAFFAKGPFASFYKDIAGATWLDWTFMLALVLIGIAIVGAGRYLGLGKYWERFEVVKKHPILT